MIKKEEKRYQDKMKGKGRKNPAKKKKKIVKKRRKKK
jgi:hypothetical protein